MTALAQQWVNDAANNNGITLIATSNDLESRYTSREYSSGQRPYLEVTTSVGQVSPVQISVTGTLASGVSRALTRVEVPAYKTPSVAVLQPGPTQGMDAEIWDGNKSQNYGSRVVTWVASGSDGISVSLFNSVWKQCRQAYVF